MVTYTSLLAIILTSLFIESLADSIYTISDERVRDIDITPVLGRGYSIMTNQYHSTCLVVEKTTTPSFNYKCEYILLTSDCQMMLSVLMVTFELDQLFFIGQILVSLISNKNPKFFETLKHLLASFNM